MPIVLSSGTPSTQTWQSWTQNWITTSSTTSLYLDNTWQAWNGTTYSSTTVTWDQWQHTVPMRFTSDYMAEAARADEEQLWAVRRAEQDRQRAKRDVLQAAARAEAHKLMAFVLTPAQMASYEARRHFDVVGSAGGIYRIHHGTSGNLRRLINGVEVNRLCVHPSMWDGDGYLPTEDCLAAQALAIMHDEVGAVGLANVHQGQRHLELVAA